MNRRVSKLIHKYASTYHHVQAGSGRAMERIAKRRWVSATQKEKHTIQAMMERRVMQSRAANAS